MVAVVYLSAWLATKMSNLCATTQYFLFIIIVTALVKPLGGYVKRVFAGRRTALDKTQSSRSTAETSHAHRRRACTSRRDHCSFERQDAFGNSHAVWSTDVSRGKSTHRGSTTETLETDQGESEEQGLTCSFTPFG